MTGVKSVALSRCVGALVAAHNTEIAEIVSIDSRLHLPQRLNPIILAIKAGASPVGVRQHKLPP
ncbi:hypothetical protein [Bradyrhizobium cosmicum]|uniref:hypothetical protein n=1 Tax=Bradyrhizobium cosmicum TaxID=1404864 RepID=UPI0002FBCF8C|nr:hypothetical protein [Bradyrhizobium cosmicum]